MSDQPKTELTPERIAELRRLLTVAPKLRVRPGDDILRFSENLSRLWNAAMDSLPALLDAAEQLAEVTAVAGPQPEPRGVEAGEGIPGERR